MRWRHKPANSEEPAGGGVSRSFGGGGREGGSALGGGGGLQKAWVLLDRQVDGVQQRRWVHESEYAYAGVCWRMLACADVC